MIFGIFLFGGYIFKEIYGAVKESYLELGRGDKSDKRDEVVGAKDPVAFLILGMDEREKENDVGRPDVLMVVTVNPNDKTVKLLSIPRDTYTYIPIVDKYDKINHSYSLAESQQADTGIESTIKTVEELLDIPIDYYVKLNFEAFVEIVDHVGGVDINVPRDFRQKAYDNGPWLEFKQGPAHLDGEHALAYVRMRKAFGGDLGRNERQREVLQNLIRQSSNIANITKIDDILETLGKNVRMNLTAPEILQLQRLYGNVPKENIETIVLEGHDNHDGRYYYMLNDGEAQRVSAILREHLELPVIPVQQEQEATGAAS